MEIDNLKQTPLKDRTLLLYLGAIALGFSAYQAFVMATGQELIAKTELEKLRQNAANKPSILVHTFNMGRSIANAAASPDDSASRGSFAGAIDNYAHIPYISAGTRTWMENVRSKATVADASEATARLAADLAAAKPAP
jgi:hypothetical protein